MWFLILLFSGMWFYLKMLTVFPFYMWILFTLIYVLYWIDGAWMTGNRAWHHLRVSSFWKRISPVKYYFSLADCATDDGVFGTDASPRKKYLFVVVPNATNAPLLWGFGLHAGRFAEKIRLRFLLPAVLFYIPFVRDVLMWCGGVAYHPGAQQQWHTINDLLNTGHSVAYACNGMLDAFSAHDREGKEIHVKTPPDQLFEFAKLEGVSLVPVVASGECERYVFSPTPPFLVTIQQFCERNWGYPFPMFYIPTRQSQIHMQFCPTIQPHLYDNATAFKQEFLRCIKSANNTGADKQIVFQ